MLPGGDLRAIASFRPTSPRPSWAAGVESGAALIVRIAPSGEFKKRLLARPLDKCIVEYRYAKGSGTTGIPFCPSPLSTDWDGGTGVASQRDGVGVHAAIVAGSAGWGRSSACVRVSGWWGLAGREIVSVCEDFREAGDVGGWAAYRATLTLSLIHISEPTRPY